MASTDYISASLNGGSIPFFSSMFLPDSIHSPSLLVCSPSITARLTSGWCACRSANYHDYGTIKNICFCSKCQNQYQNLFWYAVLLYCRCFRIRVNKLRRLIPRYLHLCLRRYSVLVIVSRVTTIPYLWLMSIYWVIIIDLKDKFDSLLVTTETSICELN